MRRVTVESSRQDIASIQILRGIAATMVVFVHLDVQLARHGFGALGSDWAASGVDIFFVISGFIMWVTTARRAGITGTQFMLNRLIRIVPLYWLISLFVLVMALVAPQLLHTTVFDPAHTLASFLFFPARHPVTEAFWPLLVPGWTLNYEMLFYVLFAASIALSGGSAFRRLILIAGAIISVLILSDLLKSRLDVLNFYASSIMLEFVAGTLLGVLYLSGRMRPSALWLVAIAAGFLVLWKGPAGMPYSGVAATAIVAGALFSPPVRIPFLQRVGDASYSLYLTHVITLAAVAAMWSRQTLLHGPLVFGFLCVAAALLVAMISYRLIEQPVTAALKRVERRFLSAPTAAPTGSPVRPSEAAE